MQEDVYDQDRSYIPEIDPAMVGRLPGVCKNCNTNILQLQLLCFVLYFVGSGASLVARVINDF